MVVVVPHTLCQQSLLLPLAILLFLAALLLPLATLLLSVATFLLLLATLLLWLRHLHLDRHFLLQTLLGNLALSEYISDPPVCALDAR